MAEPVATASRFATRPRSSPRGGRRRRADRGPRRRARGGARRAGGLQRDQVRRRSRSCRPLARRRRAGRRERERRARRACSASSGLVTRDDFDELELRRCPARAPAPPARGQADLRRRPHSLGPPQPAVTLTAMAQAPAAEPRPALGDRTGRGQARLRLLLRPHRLPTCPAPQAHDARRRRRPPRSAACTCGRCSTSSARRSSSSGSCCRCGRTSLPPDIIAELRGLQDDVRAVPLRGGRADDHRAARAADRAAVRRVRGSTDGGRVDRPGAPGDAPERQARGRQGAAAGRAAADRRRPLADVPGRPDRQGARAGARLHRHAGRWSTSSHARSGRSSTTGSRGATPNGSAATSPATRTCACRASTGATRVRACSRSSTSRARSWPTSSPRRSRWRSVAGSPTSSTEVWMTMIFRHGFFHGDPHPANILVLGSPERIGLVDFGQTGTLTDEDMPRPRACSSTSRTRTWTPCRSACRIWASATRASWRNASRRSCAICTTGTTARACPRSTRSR